MNKAGGRQARPDRTPRADGSTPERYTASSGAVAGANMSREYIEREEIYINR